MCKLHQIFDARCMSVARSSTGGVVIRWVLPVFWITSFRVFGADVLARILARKSGVSVRMSRWRYGVATRKRVASNSSLTEARVRKTRHKICVTDIRILLTVCGCRTQQRRCRLAGRHVDVDGVLEGGTAAAAGRRRSEDATSHT